MLTHPWKSPVRALGPNARDGYGKGVSVARRRYAIEQISVDGKPAKLVPAGVTHEFWNPHDEPAELILIMFGKGA